MDQLLTTHNNISLSFKSEVRKTLRNKINMYNSFTDMSTMTKLSTSNSKRKQSFLVPLFKVESNRNQSDRIDRSERKPKEELKTISKTFTIKLNPEDNNKDNKGEQQQRKTKYLRKDQIADAHHSIDFIRVQFERNGGVLSTEKKILADQVQQLSTLFNKQCKEQNHSAAVDILFTILNYTIDLKLMHDFVVTLLYLSQFLLVFGDYRKAVFYFNQTRICSQQLLDYGILIDSYIGLSRCCSKVNLHEKGILFLKKALECAWFTNNKQKELIVYDQIGIQYFRLGNIAKSKYFHERFSLGGLEREDSAVKIMVKTKFRELERRLIGKVPHKMDVVFLISMNVPVKPLWKLPSIVVSSLRKDYQNIFENDNDTYHTVHLQIQRILAEKEFEDEMSEPRYQQNEKYITMIDDRKNNFPEIDFQLNRRLLKYLPKQNKNRSKTKLHFRPKMNLQQRIDERLKSKSLHQNWYSELVERIVRDRTYNLSSLRTKVLIRSLHLHDKMPQQFYSTLYNAYFVELLC